MGVIEPSLVDLAQQYNQKVSGCFPDAASVCRRCHRSSVGCCHQRLRCVKFIAETGVPKMLRSPAARRVQLP